MLNTNKNSEKSVYLVIYGSCNQYIKQTIFARSY